MPSLSVGKTPLDVGGISIETANDEHALDAPHDTQAAGLVKETEVPVRSQPPAETLCAVASRKPTSLWFAQRRGFIS